MIRRHKPVVLLPLGQHHPSVRVDDHQRRPELKLVGLAGLFVWNEKGGSLWPINNIEQQY
jgi:hypothetical protein